jgi:hypothetical protein
MSRYTVVYLADALAELASIWSEADDRNGITAAADQAEQVLAAGPESHAIYLREQLWRIQIARLRFYFTIREEDRLIEVSNVVLVTK